MELSDIFCDSYIEYKYSIKGIFIVQSFIGRFDLTKNPKKRGIEKLLKGRGNPKEGFCRKGECC